MPNNLLIIFVKNILLGKVKTRLAKTIGDTGAFEVYKELVAITEKETSTLQNCDIRIFYSDAIIETKWPGRDKFLQVGNDLGERMQHAFDLAFKDGYRKVIGIGSDLPDLKAPIIEAGFDSLVTHDTVFGPAEDGGYYLLGMTNLYNCIFENKPWSTEKLLDETLAELDQKGLTYQLLTRLNDIDTIEDLKKSSVSAKFEHLL